MSPCLKYEVVVWNIASVAAAAAAQSRLGGGGTDLLVTCDDVSETNACYSGRQSVQEYNRAKLRGNISYSEDQQPLQTVPWCFCNWKKRLIDH